ncbi:lasso peptide biosynthesis B2 protein [Shewanella sp. 10N.286.45.A1]|uniref:lasso peptide biosynthesis B2 protein n=1 Tax=Shewanella sp. 10N.286.45.A1 TaxID=3229694 RepID=UPI00354D3CC8
MKSVLIVLRRKFASFLRRGLFFKLGFIPTWLLLGAARAMVLVFAFARLAPFLGRKVDKEAWDQPMQPLSVNTIKKAQKISRLIVTTVRYCPWNANCLAQAIVARFWLALCGVPYRIYFGLRREDADLKAHAWVCSGSYFVSGGDGFKGHTVVGCYGCNTESTAECK